MAFDLSEYICPDGQPYTLVGVDTSSGLEVCQSLRKPNGYVHFVKNHCAETIWYDGQYIYRGLDTSAIDGDEVYAQFQDGRYGAVWAKRFMNVGEGAQRSPDIQHYHKDGNTVGKPHDANIVSYLFLVAHYPQFTTPTTKIALTDVVELHWTFDPAGQNVVEKYFYARGFGLVGFNYLLGPGGYQSEIGALSSAPPPPYTPPAWFFEPTRPPVLAPQPEPVPVPPIGAPQNKSNPVPAKLVLGAVRLRGAPTTSGSILRELRLGEEVIYFEQPITRSDNYDWVWVETKNGQGYAAKSIEGSSVFSSN